MDNTDPMSDRLISSALDDSVNNLIVNQKSVEMADPSGVLDDLTRTMLSASIFKPAKRIKEVGALSIVFPKKYSDFKRIQKQTILFYPSFHQLQFFLKGDESAVLDISVSFLQPKIKSLVNKKQKTTDGVEINWTEKIAREGGKLTEGITESFPRKYKASLKISEIKLKSETKIEFQNETTEEDIKLNNEIIGKIIEGVPAVSGILFADAVKIPGSNSYKVTVKISNEAICESEYLTASSEDDPYTKSWFGTGITVKATSGTLSLKNISTENGTQEKLYHINTLPVISKSDENTLFSSPIIINDLPKVEPMLFEKTIEEITASEESLLESLDKLTPEERENLRKTNNVAKILKIIACLGLGRAKIKSLYKFQWDAIQIFIKNLIKNKNSPLLLNAPTGSGKSLIFYTCAVIMKVFQPNENGTKVFVAYPTRALNTDQFGRLVELFYHLNKNGIKISIGLYMGMSQRRREVGLIRTISPLPTPKKITEGTFLSDISICPNPNCGGKEIIGHKQYDNRVVPICTKCKEELSFVYLSSDEVQSYCPNIVIGTSDKIGQGLSSSTFSHAMFGAPSKRCPKCGYYLILNKKNQKDDIHTCTTCGNANLDVKTITRSEPCLTIFDEIHSISGMHGNLLGQFLSLMKKTSKLYGSTTKYWFMGATATLVNRAEIVSNLTGEEGDMQTEFPSAKEYWYNGKNGYFKKSNEIRHRVVFMEPLGKRHINFVPDHVVNAHFNIREMNPANEKIASVLANDYKIQTVYVLEKRTGRNLQSYIPNNAEMMGYNKDDIQTDFGSGDLDGKQLKTLETRIKDLDIDVVITTSIYGQGVDFPNLNIMHFFGVPSAFIELEQAIGRTGRGKIPGLIFVHIRPQTPRDEWMYANSNHVMQDINELFEPSPINVMNRYAISQSLPNILCTLLGIKQSSDYRFMLSNKCATYLQDENNLNEILEQIKKIYIRPETSTDEEERILTTIYGTMLDMLIPTLQSGSATESGAFTSAALRGKLLTSLRSPNRKIQYLKPMDIPPWIFKKSWSSNTDKVDKD